MAEVREQAQVYLPPKTSSVAKRGGQSTLMLGTNTELLFTLLHRLCFLLEPSAM